MSTFSIGQVLKVEDGFPYEACKWAAQNKAKVMQNGDNFEIVAIPEPTEEEIKAQLQAQYTNYIQTILDNEAKKLGYDSCLSVCSYINTGVIKFDIERRCVPLLAFGCLE